MYKLSFIVAVFLWVLSVSPVSFALDLQQAKSQGLVGEMANGYLGAPNPASGEVQALIADINAKRKVRYTQVAKKVAKPLSIVEQLAGEKAQTKTQPGHYIQTANGQWKKK